MIKVHGLLAIWFLASVSAGVYGQEIVAIKTDLVRLSPNTPISFQVDFNLANVPNPYCGVEISFGDGNSQTIRAGLNGAQDFPLRLTHSYAAPGKYVVKVEGKTAIRGFKSAAACQGSDKQIQLTIVDEAVERAKQEAVRKERELAAKQIELQQLAEKIEREKNEQALKEQKLREQELMIKQLALEQKEREMKQKEREMQQNKRPAQQKDSPRDTQISPAVPTPSQPPTSNRRTVDGF